MAENSGTFVCQLVIVLLASDRRCATYDDDCVNPISRRELLYNFENSAVGDVVVLVAPVRLHFVVLVLDDCVAESGVEFLSKNLLLVCARDSDVESFALDILRSCDKRYTQREKYQKTDFFHTLLLT